MKINIEVDVQKYPLKFSFQVVNNIILHYDEVNYRQKYRLSITVYENKNYYYVCIQTCKKFQDSEKTKKI